MQQPTRAEAVKKLLDSKTQPDLARLYHPGMECQVNVARDDGERKDGYSGRSKQTYTDGVNTWFAFRIPKDAWSDPVDNSQLSMSYPIFEHAEGVGMTGWCFSEFRSRWVAFDFDSIVGHSDRHAKKMSDEELDKVRDAAMGIPWVEVRRSASGNGLHLYVHFAVPVPTKDHTEHAALGHAVLAEMSALASFDFQAKVDTCGGNMWVWHRKMPKGPSGGQSDGKGLQLVKEAKHPMLEAPKGWTRYVKVTKGERKKSLPEFADGREATFDETVGQQPHVALDDDHKKLVAWLQANQGWGWWDEGHRMLVTHTHHLKRAHQALQMRGGFETTSPATQVEEQNCFCFPMRNGAWSVRRYSPGAAEHASWEQDGKGWTRCFLNRDPDLRGAARARGGVETAQGSFQFPVADDVREVVKLLGGALNVPDIIVARPANVMPHKDGRRIVVEVDAFQQDDPSKMVGWYKEKGKRWRTVVNANARADDGAEVGTIDEMIRHCVTEQHLDAGWYVKVDDAWNAEPKQNVSLAMLSVGKKRVEVDQLMGASVLKPWTIVHRPFEDEYVGNRSWNKSKVKLLYPRSDEEGDWSTWRNVLMHTGAGLDDALLTNGWALHNGIKHGADYLELWLASMIQNPYDPLPYVFLWSTEEDTGKSIVHEMMKLVMSEEGIVEVNKIVDGKDGFNGQMEGAILCVVEELDLQKSKGAYERIKNWVTSPRISIRHLFIGAYMAPNTTHWIHCANKHTACPIFPGDTRITMIEVAPLTKEQMIPKPDLMEKLKREAPHFLNHLLSLEIPASGSRLRVPTINTSMKDMIAAATMNELEAFLDENCYVVAGESILYSDFMDRFIEGLDSNDVPKWKSRGEVSKAMPPRHPIGKRGPDTYIGNISWEKKEPTKAKLVLKGRQLVPSGA